MHLTSRYIPHLGICQIHTSHIYIYKINGIQIDTRCIPRVCRMSTIQIFSIVPCIELYHCMIFHHRYIHFYSPYIHKKKRYPFLLLAVQQYFSYTHNTILFTQPTYSTLVYKVFGNMNVMPYIYMYRVIFHIYFKTPLVK